MFKIIPDSVWKLLVEQIATQREDLRTANARIDRLTEALSYKVNVPLVMPQTPLPQIPQSIIPEKSSGGWWDVKPIPAVIQKPSGGNSK